MRSFARLRNVLYNFNASVGLKNVSSYSTRTVTTNRGRPWKKSMDELYHRISPLGNPNVSIVPTLDQWVEEGGAVDKEQLHVFIKELRSYKRYTHALQISMWMTEKRYLGLTARDVAVRLDLIAKVHGIEQAENFFNNVPQNLRVLEVYSALLNCYARAEFVEKAEAVMQKMRDLDLAMISLSYNVLLNLYFKTGNNEKFAMLIQEMKEKGVTFDKFTYCILLNAYVAASDMDKIRNVLKEMESDPQLVFDWSLYAIVANGYTKSGLLDEAVAMLKKAEDLVTWKKRGTAYNFLLTQYAATGKKDEVLRLWEIYKKKEKIYNKGYMSVISSLLKFDDIESAEQIIEDWLSQDLHHDIRIANFLIGAYCRLGLLEKAENLISELISRGGKPDAFTWYYLATTHLKKGETWETVEAMKKALLVCRPRWKPDKEILAACLKYFKEEGDVEEAEEFIGILRDKDIVSQDVYNRLLSYIRGETSTCDIHSELKSDGLVENE